MSLLARYPDRSYFDLGGPEGLGSLPVALRDKMLKQVDEWRAQEDAAFAKMKR